MLQFHLKNSKGGKCIQWFVLLTDENLHPSCCCSRDNEDLWESHKTQRLHLELEKIKHECGQLKKLQTAAYFIIRTSKISISSKTINFSPPYKPEL